GAVEQVDQRIQPVGVAGEMLHHALHGEPCAGGIFAALGKREDGPVHVILLRNLPKERHTGHSKTACDGGLWTIGIEWKSHRPPYWKVRHQRREGLTTVLMPHVNTSAGRPVKGGGPVDVPKNRRSMVAQSRRG